MFKLMVTQAPKAPPSKARSVVERRPKQIAGTKSVKSAPSRTGSIKTPSCNGAPLAPLPSFTDDDIASEEKDEPIDEGSSFFRRVKTGLRSALSWDLSDGDLRRKAGNQKTSRSYSIPKHLGAWQARRELKERVVTRDLSEARARVGLCSMDVHKHIRAYLTTTDRVISSSEDPSKVVKVSDFYAAAYHLLSTASALTRGEMLAVWMRVAGQKTLNLKDSLCPTKCIDAFTDLIEDLPAGLDFQL